MAKLYSNMASPQTDERDEMLIEALARGEGERHDRLGEFLERAEEAIKEKQGFKDFSNELIGLTRIVEPTEIMTRGVKMNPAEQERNRILEITAIGEKTGMSDIANQYIESGKSIEEFRKAVLEKMDSNIIPIDSSHPARSGLIGMSQKEIERYSLSRLILALAGERGYSLDGIELEASQAVARQKGRQPRGFFIPEDVLNFKQQRDLTYASATGGGYIVGTDLLSASFIELLRNKIVCIRMGAFLLDGLVGNVDIPGLADGAQAYWVGEGVNITESQQTFRHVTMEPHTVGALTEMTRRLLLQSTPKVDELVKSDFAKIIAQEIDRVAIGGSGVGAQPTGLLNTAGIGVATWNAANPLLPVVELETDVAVGNADIGALAYLTSAQGRGFLKSHHTNTTYGEIPLWTKGREKDIGELNSYDAYCSNQIGDDLKSGGTSGSSGDNRTYLIFGNWNDLVIGQWSGLDMIVDPYTHSASGTLRIVVFQDVDIAIRQPESFSYTLMVV